MHWNGDWHMGWMGIWWIVGAALIALVIWALLRSSRGPMNGSSESPELVLKRQAEVKSFSYDELESAITWAGTRASVTLPTPVAS